MSPTAIISPVDLYAGRTHLSPHSVGRYAAGSGDFYVRLKRGRDLTTRRAARVTQWFSDRWPTDLAWPDDIPRPDPTPGSPAALAAGEAAARGDAA